MRSLVILVALISSAYASAQKTLTVFAAASLREPIQAIAKQYEADHPEFKVQLTFAGSQQLAAQINAGAKCDVFAAASPESFTSIKLMEPGHLFATNRLVLVAPKGSRAFSLKGLASMKSIVLAAPAVPAGQYAREALRLASKSYGASWLKSVMAHVVSEEQDVRSVLAKIQLGEAEAGIVYVTDALSAKGKVEAFPIPAEDNVTAQYPVGIPAGAGDRDDSRHFIHAITDPFGQAALKSAGFGSPFEPAAGFTVENGSKALSVRLATFRGKTLVKFDAAGPHGIKESFAGYAIQPLLPTSEFKEAVMTAADWYQVTVPYSDLKKGYIIPMKDGNFKIVIPGSSPANWVNWLRSIKLK